MATLTQYLTATRRLLQNPPAPESLYSTADLTAHINTARGQLAGESECVRVMGTLTMTAGTRIYSLSTINVSAAPGVSGVFNARILQRVVGDGLRWMRPFEWPRFSQYYLNRVVPVSGQPEIWSQFGQGASGSIYVDPVPDTGYTASVDCVCRPVDLIDDSTPDAIPYPFSDAVPFFACYYALLGAQSQARQADADRMMERYEEFKNRARAMSNPSVLPLLYEGRQDPTMANKLAIGGMQR